MQWVTTKNQLAQRSDVVNSKTTTCFSYIPTMLTNALPDTQWIRDMGTWQQALAQQWSPLPVLPGASTGEPTHDKVMWERPDGQGESGLEGTPRPAWASTPKPESVCFTILRLSPTPLTLTGGYPWPPFSEGNQLRALVNKPPGHNRSVSIQTPQMAF